MRAATADDAPANDLDDAADLEFGRTIREMVDARYGAGAGRSFRDTLIEPTRPGTEARAVQDRAFDLLTARLAKLVGAAA